MFKINTDIVATPLPHLKFPHDTLSTHRFTSSRRRRPVGPIGTVVVTLALVALLCPGRIASAQVGLACTADAELNDPACETVLTQPLVAASSLSLGLETQSAQSAHMTAEPSVSPAEDMVFQLNLLRLSKGLFPLKLNSQLVVSAQHFAEHMAQRNFFSHYDPDTNCNKPWDRMTAAGYVWGTAAENIAAGFPTVGSTMQGFIDSPSHYSAMVSPRSREVGIGHYRDNGDGINVRLISTCPGYQATSGPYVFYWVQNFGSRHTDGQPHLPVIINNEAFATDMETVSLFIYGGEAGQPMWASQMRFSVDGQLWSAYEPWSASKTVELPAGSGFKTVYAELMNSTGATQIVSDTIYLEDSLSRDISSAMRRIYIPALSQ